MGPRLREDDELEPTPIGDSAKKLAARAVIPAAVSAVFYVNGTGLVLVRLSGR